MVVGVDVDEVLAQLLPRWLAIYNREWGDLIRLRDVDQWDMSKVVAPECGGRIYHYLRRADLYDEIRVVPRAKWGVEQLVAAGHEVIYLSSTAAGSTDSKLRWLDRHGFTALGSTVLLRGQDAAPPDKGIVRLDVLVDDYPVNLHAAARNGTRGILFRGDAPYNHHETAFDVAHDWGKVVELINGGGNGENA